MAFDPAAAGVLLGEICRIVVDSETGLSSSARTLSAKSAEVEPLFRDFINEDESAMAQAAAGLGVDPQALAFFLSTTACGRRCADVRGSFPVS